MTVIAADFVPIAPYKTRMLDIAIGQRYDVIVEANQAASASSFWMRAIPQLSCTRNTNVDDIRGILYYGTTADTPSTTGYTYMDACVDEDMTNLTPHLRLDAGNPDHLSDEAVALNRAAGVTLWTVDSVSFNASWSNPTLLQIYNSTKTNFAAENHVIKLDESIAWEYLIIHSNMPVPHPIHLHGHDFYILAQGSGPSDFSALTTLSNLPRRDVALLPASGHLVLAFKTDNPGAWLLHCHIGWHTDMGLALQFVEQPRAARDWVDYGRLNSICQAWNEYVVSNNVSQYQYDDGV